MVISTLDMGMGGRVQAAIKRVIPANHAHDPLTSPNAARHPPVMAEYSLWRAARWKTRTCLILQIPTNQALRPNTENWDDDFEVETRNRHATSWTATPILGADEEGRTVTARLWCAGAFSRFTSSNPFATSTHAVLPL